MTEPTPEATVLVCPACGESPMDVSCACCGHGYPANTESLLRKVTALQAQVDDLWDGKSGLECDRCGRLTANGTCTECRHGTSPMAKLKAQLVERQAEVDRQADVGIRLAADVAGLKAVMRECVNNCDCDEPCANCLRVEAALAGEAL